MRRVSLPAVLLLAAVSAAQEPVFLLDPDSAFDEGSTDTRAVEPADFDGDGRMDLFVANVGSPNDLYRNGKGGLVLHAPTVVSQGDTPSMGGAWGDMDGDGDPDLAVANGSDTPNQLFRNLGSSGTYTGFAAVLGDPAVALSDPTQALAWGDLDGDGDLDLVTANKRERNGLYLNDGGGAFVAAVGGSLVSEVGPCRDVALADLDGDGDLDALFPNSNDEPNFVHVNQGGAQGGLQGEFALMSPGDPLCDDAHPSFGVSVADVEGDGDLDVFITNRKGVDNVLYLNEGAGAFSVAHAMAPSRDGGDSFASCWADVNADGLPDLYVANQLQAGFLYLNGPAGLERVTDGQLVTMVQNSRDAVFVVLGDDELPDLVVANSVGEQSLVFQNLERYRVDTKLLRPAGAPDADAKGRLRLEARPLEDRHRLDLVVERVDPKRSYGAYLEDAPGSGAFAPAGDLRRQGHKLVLKLDTSRGDAFPLGLGAQDLVGRWVEVRRDGETLLSGLVGTHDSEAQRQWARAFLVRTGHGVDEAAVGVVQALSLPHGGVERLSLAVDIDHDLRPHELVVHHGGAPVSLGALAPEGGRLAWSADLSLGLPGLPVVSVAELSGLPLQVLADGTPVLAGPVPVFSEAGASKGREVLERAPGVASKLWGWTLLRAHAVSGDERFAVTVRGQGAGDLELVLWIETAPGSARMEPVADFSSADGRAAHVLAMRRRGDPLPFAVDGVAELTGRRVEVRDGQGRLLLHGVIPPLR